MQADHATPLHVQVACKADAGAVVLTPPHGAGSRHIQFTYNTNMNAVLAKCPEDASLLDRLVEGDTGKSWPHHVSQHWQTGGDAEPVSPQSGRPYRCAKLELTLTQTVLQLASCGSERSPLYCYIIRQHVSRALMHCGGPSAPQLMLALQPRGIEVLTICIRSIAATLSYSCLQPIMI